MRKVILIRLLLVIVALAIAGGIWIVLQPPKPLTVTVTFTGYTNDYFGRDRATFVVTNHNDVSVKRWHVWRVERTDGAPPQDAAYAVVDELPTPSPAVAFLAPRQSESLTLPIPTNRTVWRALLRCSADGWKYRYAMWRAGNSKTRKLADQLHIPYPSLPHQYIASNWIEPAPPRIPLVTAVVELPDGTQLNGIEGYCTTRQEIETKGRDSSGHSTSSGTGCELLWYRAPIQDGTVTRTLSFSNFVSGPVTITFKNGTPDVTNFVFKMRSTQ